MQSWSLSMCFHGQRMQLYLLEKKIVAILDFQDDRHFETYFHKYLFLDGIRYTIEIFVTKHYIFVTGNIIVPIRKAADG